MVKDKELQQFIYSCKERITDNKIITDFFFCQETITNTELTIQLQIVQRYTFSMLYDFLSSIIEDIDSTTFESDRITVRYKLPC